MTPADRARAQQRAQHKRDARLARMLAGDYQRVHRQISRDLGRLTEQIEGAREAGRTVDQAWLAEHGRLRNLDQQVREHVAVFVTAAAPAITRAQRDAAAAGVADAAAHTGRSAITPLSALVDRFQQGRPLADHLLAALPDHAAQTVRSALVAGVALGRNPRVIARQARDALGGNLARALVIARTETLGAYRAAALDGYRRSGVVTGWVWLAALTARTCPVCWAMHGTHHTLDETLASHPACRCTMLPDQGTPLSVNAGDDEFAQQPAAVQRAVLGPGRYNLYRAGDVRLSDLVVETPDPVWGAGRRVRPLRELREAGLPPPSSVNEARTLAESLLRRAAPAEPAITADLDDLVQAVGGRLAGRENRLKTTESLARKIASDAAAKNVSLDAAAAAVNDVVRYTAVNTPAAYTAAAKRTLAELENRGYTVRAAKNYWQRGDPYNGLNTVVTSPAGQTFELQFHTAASLAVKRRLHPLYEEYRAIRGSTRVAELRRDKLRQQMIQSADTAEAPAGVATVGTLIRQT